MEITPGSYRLRSEAIGLQQKGDHLVSVIIPQDAILVVALHSQIKHRFIECTWNGQPLLVFAPDLLQSGELTTFE